MFLPFCVEGNSAGRASAVICRDDDRPARMQNQADCFQTKIERIQCQLSFVEKGSKNNRFVGNMQIK